MTADPDLAASPRGAASALRVLRFSALVALGVMAASSLLPWLASGRSRRSAYGLARSARTLGFVDTPFRRVAYVALFVMPVIIGLVLVAVSLSRWSVALTLTVLEGAFGAVASYFAFDLPGATQPGPVVGGIASLLTASTALGALIALSRFASVPERQPSAGTGMVEAALETGDELPTDIVLAAASASATGV